MILRIGSSVNQLDDSPVDIPTGFVKRMFIVCSIARRAAGAAEPREMPFCNDLPMEMDTDRECGPTWLGMGARHVTKRPPSENGEWRVGDDGLEHVGTGYFIEREGMDRRRADGLWFWPLHMLEKAWCAPDTFSDAFRRAVSAYGLSAGRDLEASFLAAARVKAESGLWGRVAREVGLREAAPEPIRLGELAKVSAEACRRNASGSVVAARGTVSAARRRHG